MLPGTNRASDRFVLIIASQISRYMPERKTEFSCFKRITPVSYTHLDVYKRQVLIHRRSLIYLLPVGVPYPIRRIRYIISNLP